MIERSLFSPEHEAFRDSFRRFMDKEIAPFHAEWEEQGYVDREVWRKAGANGFLCMTMPEAYGGGGADKLYSVVQMEELSRGGFSGIGFGLHSEIVAPYILHYGSEAQKRKYLPLLASGETIGEHSGIHRYTIGQRRGLGIAHEKPLYVLQIERAKNQIIVGEADDLESIEFVAKGVNWVAFDEPMHVSKPRYEFHLRSAIVFRPAQTRLNVSLV